MAGGDRSDMEVVPRGTSSSSSSNATPPQFETWKVTVGSSGVADLVLNRPSKANALNSATWRELPQAMSWLDTCPAAHVVILKGAGKHFCSGLEVEVLAELMAKLPRDCEARKRDALRRAIKDFQLAFTSFERCRKPVIAAIHGACIGGGIDMVTACDLRYCTDDAQFAVKEVDLAITADVGTLQRLPHLVGHGRAMELSLTGRAFDGKEAAALGLVNRSFATHDALMTAVEEMAEDIASKSSVAVEGTKAILLHSRDHSVADGLDYVATWNAGMLISKDIGELLKARSRQRPRPSSKL
ncbi:hypothetical protein CBR_g50345 [Chara braunii]|uniref:Uncharacterized protein n=1 Tax=Chara braunii TaxID=69332 RepID=A0A388K5G9_CHABU|nr:hypothetical protein CBR_g50345 [Chara braunii]|eukprot:GBG65304.1 hypothetical protein CBR_g50345 [Chara braunii]